MAKTVVRAGCLIDGVHDEPLEKMEIWIEDGIITGVKSGFTGSSALDGVDVLDGEDLTVMPGLIDAHVHIGASSQPGPYVQRQVESQYDVAIRAVANARATLLGGVTTVRVMGTRDGIDLHLRDCINRGVIPGPRIHAAGRGLCITGGHGWYHSIEADGPGEFRTAARGLIKAGVDAIKIKVTGGVMTPGIEPGVPQMDLEEIEAVLSEARKRDIPVAGHTEGTEGIKAAVRAGIDSIEHGYFIDDEESLVIMQEKGMYLVPTLIAYDLIAEGGDMGVPAEAVRNAQMTVDTNQESFRMAVEAGVLVAMGSDAGTAFNDHGLNGRELEYMVRCGMTPMQAIKASTAGGADLLGIADEVGTIEAGKAADIIGVNGDPTTHIACVTDVAAVLFGGTVVKDRGHVRV